MKNLQYWRMARNLTQGELAERVGTGKTMISACESGARSPQVNLAVAIAKELDVTIGELIGETHVYEIDPKKRVVHK